MHFQLPPSLRTQVAAYDPVLKPLIAEQKKSVSKKTTYPLGLVDDLLPAAYVSTEKQLEIVKYINSQPSNRRFTTGESEKLSWFVVHHESIWLATWFYKAGDFNRPECIYGMRIAFKAAPSTADKIRSLRMGTINMTERSEMQCSTYGRTAFYHRTRLFTEKDIQMDIGSSLPQNTLISGYGALSRPKREASKEWSAKLAKTIPVWTDTSLFHRIREGNSIRACIFHNDCEKHSGDIDVAIFTSKLGSRNRRFIESPYGQREINKTIQQCRSLYFNPSTQKRSSVREPFEKLYHQMERVEDLLRLYPDAPLDYCQKMYEMGQYFNCIRVYGEEKAFNEWIRNNMPISSFMGIIEKAVNQRKEELASRPSKSEELWDRPLFWLTELQDTLAMIQNILNSSPDATLEKPSRWRITEFHDHVASEAFKISNPNEKLRQDFIPEPIRVDLFGKRWTFLQPQDIHQLSSWGQAVRNCVGHANSYREGIKKRTHFIVLVMIDNKPRFTVQHKVNNGTMTVEQMTDIANRRVSDQDLGLYQMAFSEAIKIADSRLQG